MLPDNAPSRRNALQDRFDQLSAIAQSLLAESDTARLLGHIMDAGMRLTDSDAGSLYLVVEERTASPAAIRGGCADGLALLFAYARNRSMTFAFESFVTPLRADSINGHAALTGEPLRIDDAWRIPADAPYRHNRSFDDKTGYRTGSMLTVPMKDREGGVIGVLQLINRRRDPEGTLDLSGSDVMAAILPYTADDERLMLAFAGQAAAALENSRLHSRQQALLDEQRALNLQLADANRRLEDTNVQLADANRQLEDTNLQLADANRQLEDTNLQLADANQQLEAANTQLLALSRRILTAHEEERRRIARDLHDGPAQAVANLVLRAEIIRRLQERDDANAAAAQLERLQSAIRDATAEIRGIMYDLKPSWLEDGLFRAIEARCGVFRDNTGITPHLSLAGQDGDLPQYLAPAVFQAVSEALVNIGKYARATETWVAVTIADGRLTASIRDNGVGFSQEETAERLKDRKPGSGFGLEGMRERIALLRGTLAVQTAPGAGTEIRFEIPL